MTLSAIWPACCALRILAGKVFLDIGCGSGIHSLAALRLGAERVISFDYDRELCGDNRACAGIRQFAIELGGHAGIGTRCQLHVPSATS